MRKPTNTAISLPYGSQEAPYSVANPHGGTDFRNEDRRIYAVESGTIVNTGWMGTAGNAVELQGANGRKWRYCHLSTFYVRDGQQVREGDIIATMGDTGKFPDGSPSAFGVHLHLVLFVNGNRTDPMSVLNQATTPPPIKASTNTNGGRKLVDANDLNHIYQYGPLQRARNTGEGENVYLGKPAAFVLADHAKSAEAAHKVAARKAEIASLTKRIESLDATSKRQAAEIVSLTRQRDELQAQLQALTDNDIPYNFVDEQAVVVIDAQADRLNLRAEPSADSDITDTVANGASVATVGYVTDGAEVNGNPKWYKTLNGYYFTAAYAHVQPDITVEDKLLEDELDKHLDEIANADFKDTFDKFRGKFRAVMTVKVYDYANKLDPIELKEGQTFISSGTFKRSGITFIRTQKSFDNGSWYGIPQTAVEMLEAYGWLDDDSLFDLDDLKASVSTTVNSKDKLLAALGRPFDIIANIAARVTSGKS